MIDTDEIYYRALSITDRIYDVLIKKYGSLGCAGQMIKNCPSYYISKQANGTTVRMDTLYDVAKICNVSLEWLITGKNKKEFEDNEITYLPLKVKLKWKDADKAARITAYNLRYKHYKFSPTLRGVLRVAAALGKDPVDLLW